MISIEKQKSLNVEMSPAVEKFIELISDKLNPDEFGEETYYLETGVMTDGSIVAIFTPV